jgi:glutathione S-transferase
MTCGHGRYHGCMKTLQVLGRGSSINVRKVLWTCHELGLAPEHVEWGSAALPLSSPEFLRLNPSAMVPVLVHDGFVLRESNSICRYLATLNPTPALLPQGAQERARVEQWMDWQATELNNAWRYAFMALVRHSPAHTDAAAVQASTTQWNHQMALLDSALAQTGAFVAGQHFTLADIVLGLSTHRWLSTPFTKPDLPAVARWHEGLLQREGFQRFGANPQLGA